MDHSPHGRTALQQLNHAPAEALPAEVNPPMAKDESRPDDEDDDSWDL
ncbi:hypothetical protein [Streptosporangium sandarakinum]